MKKELLPPVEFNENFKERIEKMPEKIQIIYEAWHRLIERYSTLNKDQKSPYRDYAKTISSYKSHTQLPRVETVWEMLEISGFYSLNINIVPV